MTEFLARVSAQRPLVVILLWVLLVIGGLGISGTLLDGATTTEFRLAGRYESEQAAALLEERLRGPQKSAEIVIVQSDSLTVEDEAFEAKVKTLHAEIAALMPEIVSGGLDDKNISDLAPQLVDMGFPDSPVSHYYQIAEAAAVLPQEQSQQLLPLLVSVKRNTVMMHYTLAGTTEEATTNVAELVHIIEEANRDPDFLVLIGGTASVAHEQNELAEQDLQKGERFGVPVALLVLLVLFGAVVATLIPLGLSLVSIVVALAFVALIGQQFQLVFFVTIMVVMIGLAVGIDYSLLIVLRSRKNWGRDTPPG